jgi:hypothetical protein
MHSSQIAVDLFRPGSFSDIRSGFQHDAEPNTFSGPGNSKREFRRLLSSKIGAHAMRLRLIIAALAFAIASVAGVAEETQEPKPFTPQGGRCTFAMPGGQAPVSIAYQRGEGDDAAKGRLFCFDQLHCRCQVRYVDLPDSAKGLSRLEIATKYGFETWSDPGKLKTTGAVKAGEYEGEAFIVKGLPTEPGTPQSVKPYNEVRVRVFVVGSRAFLVSSCFYRDNVADAEPEAKAFLDSFRVEGK